ncbi:peptidoglycan DD-metalloendopeptidase family protein [Pseudoxanthobacter sp. M-2]|uniref:peptidoglycan DD-metalloendopeptidase family protein n=1 Tax=Pseudoxanthobacter sp. M-2 TaxID=3078754 RepID=UPI0038FC4B01
MSAAMLAAAGVAGCSGDFSRLSMGPMFTASTDNQRAVMGANPEQDIVTGSVPSGTVQTTALAPPGGAHVSAATGPARQYRGWTTMGGTTVTVAAGDTATTLSRRYGVPEDALLATNGMTNAQQIVPGRHVVIPVFSSGGAAVAAAPAAGGMPATHKVVAGDTLLSIARTYGVPASSIAQANGLPDNGIVKLGQTLRIPGATGANTRVAALPTANDAMPAKAPDVKPVTPAPVAAGTPPTTLDAQAQAPAAAAAPTEVASLPALAGQAGATATDAAPAAAESPEEAGSGFRWPARGRIVAGFGRRPNGEQNDGINIALPEGTPIKAAESGTVIYAGNELTGFGNLVLVRHADGWVTAYAHAKEITVARGAEVRRGQVIGTVGATGAVNQPQLHFELRKGSTPVDPLPHLSGA